MILFIIFLFSFDIGFMDYFVTIPLPSPEFEFVVAYRLEGKRVPFNS